MFCYRVTSSAPISHSVDNTYPHRNYCCMHGMCVVVLVTAR